MRQPIERPLQIQAHAQPPETIEQFIGTGNAQTVPRPRACGAYDPS